MTAEPANEPDTPAYRFARQHVDVDTCEREFNTADGEARREAFDAGCANWYQD